MGEGTPRALLPSVAWLPLQHRDDSPPVGACPGQSYEGHLAVHLNLTLQLALILFKLLFNSFNFIIIFIIYAITCNYINIILFYCLSFNFI